MTNQAKTILEKIRKLFSEKQYFLVKREINTYSFLCDDINNSDYWTITQGLYLLATEELNNKN